MLLAAQKRLGAETARLACYSGAGFTEGLERIAEDDPGIVLIDLARLYA